jgi:hypothetical protein
MSRQAMSQKTESPAAAQSGGGRVTTVVPGVATHPKESTSTLES